jgi:hypothetical protein
MSESVDYLITNCHKLSPHAESGLPKDKFLPFDLSILFPHRLRFQTLTPPASKRNKPRLFLDISERDILSLPLLELKNRVLLTLPRRAFFDFSPILSRKKVRELRNFIRRHDLLCFFSNSPSARLMALEAMNMGKLVLVSRPLARSSHIEHRQNGFIVSRSNFEQVCKDVVDMSQDAGKINGMGLAAHQAVVRLVSGEIETALSRIVR